jgi:phenylacetate-coenzyme A ligase PaaK-like adenylate-forming protein
MTISLTTDTQHAAMPDTLLRQLHVDEERRVMPEHLQRLHWSAERLKAERRRRLRELVRVAKAQSPWHRDRLEGIDSERLEEGDLSQLPAMTKDDVMSNFDEIVTDRRLSLERVESHLAGLGPEPSYLLDEYQAVVSGGSSGVRGVFLYDWDAWAECFAAGYRYLFRDYGGQPLSMAVIAAGSAAHISRAILQTFSDPQVLITHPLPITLPVDRIVAGLNQSQPDTLLIYPSGLVQLIDAARAGALTITPRAIVSGGEPLAPEVRQAAESVFDTKVLNWWLSTEAGPMGIGCGHGPWMHLSDDLIILEPVDDNGHAVPAGVRSSKVLLTVLYNHALPLIRYELTDEVTLLDATCPCGSAHALIEDVQGRRDESFIYDGVTVHPTCSAQCSVAPKGSPSTASPRPRQAQASRFADAATSALCNRN